MDLGEKRRHLEQAGIRVDAAESDAYVAERFRYLPCWRFDGARFVADQLPSDQMGAGMPLSELEDICAGRKTTWSTGGAITEAQRRAACAAVG